MRKIRKFVPAALLFAGLTLGLGINTSCDKKEPLETPLIDQSFRDNYDEHQVINHKHYFLKNKTYKSYDDKSFRISSTIKMLNYDEFDVTYHNYANNEGKFDKEILELVGYPDLPYKIMVHAKRKDSELEIEKILIYDLKNPLAIITENYKDTELKLKYFNLGLEKLNTFNEIFKIKEEIKQAKGKNLFHLLSDFDITDLTENDFRKRNTNEEKKVLFAKKDQLNIFAHSYSLSPFNKYGFSIRIANKSNSYTMIIQDFKNDGSIEDISFIKIADYPFNETNFEMKDGNYKYDKSIYTEEQIKKIFEDARQKLSLIHKLKEQITKNKKD